MAGIKRLTTTPTTPAASPLYDEQAEQAVLGAMLTNTESVSAVQDILTAEDYYFERHRDIHRVVMRLTAEDTPAEIVTVGGALRDHRGIRDYLSTLCDYTFTTTNAKHYAKLVRDLSLVRSVVRAGQEIVEMGHARDVDVRALIDAAEQRILAISPPVGSQSMSPMADITARILDDLNAGVPAKSWFTGFGQLDEKLGGLHPCSFIVIGARPGIGKTALALNIARQVAQEGQVLFFSLEMSADELGERYLCTTASANLRSLRERNVTPDKRADLFAAQALAEKSNLKVIYDPRVTLAGVRSISRRQRAKESLALIIVDYLQLLRSGEREDTRWAEVSTLSRELKILARELEVPVLALSQLNRESQSHWSDGKPQLSQLRESGAIEQDADAVLLLSWPKDRQGYVVVNVAKNRHGPLGEVELSWQPQYMRFGG